MLKVKSFLLAGAVGMLCTIGMPQADASPLTDALDGQANAVTQVDMTGTANQATVEMKSLDYYLKKIFGPPTPPPPSTPPPPRVVDPPPPPPTYIPHGKDKTPKPHKEEIKHKQDKYDKHGGPGPHGKGDPGHGPGPGPRRR